LLRTCFGVGSCSIQGAQGGVAVRDGQGQGAQACGAAAKGGRGRHATSNAGGAQPLSLDLVWEGFVGVVQDEQEEVPDGEYEDLSTAFRMLSFENPAGRPPEAPRMAKPKKRTGPCRKQSEEPASEASEAPEKAAPEPLRKRVVRRGAVWGRGRGRGRGAKSRGRGRGRGRGRRASPQKSLSPSSERTPEETSSSEAASGEEAEDAEESAPAPTVRRSKRQAASKPVNYQESDEGDAEDMDLDED